jgi:hypothetical protein
MSPRLILALILAVVVLAAWIRLILWHRAAPVASRARSWRLGVLLALQPVCAALLFFGLFPPGERIASESLTIATAGTSQAAATRAGGRLILLPESGALIGGEAAPDLATALRRHPDAGRIRVLGQGLTPRDRDAVTGVGLSFEPTPLQPGLVQLSPPQQTARGAAFDVGGQAAGLEKASVELLDPAGRVTDRQPVEENGGFRLTGTARAAGLTLFKVRLVSNGRIVEEANVPIRVARNAPPRLLILAGAPGPEVKYLRRWATDAGFSVTTQTSAGGGVALGDAPIPITGETLRRFDVAVIDDRSWDSLGGGRGVVRDAVRDGLGLVLRSGGSPDGGASGQWRSLGFAVSGGGPPVPIALPPAGEAALARTRRGIAPDDTPADFDPGYELVPEISRLSLIPGGERAVPLLTDAGGQTLSAWRASGRGRIAIFTGLDSFGLVLTGRSDLYGDWWGEMLSTVVRPEASPTPAFEGTVWAGERVALCDLAGEPRVEAPSGAVSKLTPDPAAGDCAGYWPSEAGWSLLRARTAEGAETVWPFYVYPAEALPTARAARDRDATLMLVKPGSVAAKAGAETPGSPWPWLAGWLILTCGLWWFERSSRGRGSNRA